MCGLSRQPAETCFHWRNLDLVSAEVQFGFSITLITEGIGRTCNISLHMESLILSLNCTTVLRCHRSNAVGLNIFANDLQLWVAFILL